MSECESSSESSSSEPEEHGETEKSVSTVPGEKNKKKKSKPKIDELMTILDDGYSSEVELNTRKLVTQMNRKKKKSGGFQSMGLSFPVYKGIQKRGYKIPTPIQRKCIPLIMQGKDVVAMARTGSGKTASFLIPMFEKLQTSSTLGVRALLLSPTRELALQTFTFVKEIGKYMKLRTALILGGDGMEQQFAALHENPDVIIATPGRLMHILVEMEQKLLTVEYLVFDEADRLFELGFQEQLLEIIRRVPEDRQTLLFSATLPKQLVEFAKAGLDDPTLVRLDVDTKISDQLKLSFIQVRLEDKMAALLHLLTEVFEDGQQTIVFVATKHHVEYIRQIFSKLEISCSYVYSSLDQTARKMMIDQFRAKKTDVLLVTDVAARGLDIPMLDNVINVSFPSKPKLFLHRVGRVARAGRTGTAYSLVSPDELPYVLDVHLFLGKSLNIAQADSKGYNAWDSVYGKASQTLIDSENDSLARFKKDNELKDLVRVSTNAYNQYLKSRPQASAESIKRAKYILKTIEIAMHPLYNNTVDESEEFRMKLLAGVRDYKPNATIFEIGATAKETRSVVMKKSRKKNAAFIAKYQDKLKEKRKELSEGLTFQRDATTADKDEEDQKAADKSENDQLIKDSFSKVIGPSKRSSSQAFNFDNTNNKKKKKSQKTDFKDDEFYIDYKPKDFHTETGLTLGSNQANFAKESSTVSFDLLGDDDQQIRKQKGQQKVWDRKRKRFVNADMAGTKKIKTESGSKISASYKKNLYEDWKRRSKIDEQDNIEREVKQDYRRGFNKSKSLVFQPGGKPGRPMFGGGGNSERKPRSELKRPEQILKQRKMDAIKKNTKVKNKKRGKKRRR